MVLYSCLFQFTPCGRQQQISFLLSNKTWGINRGPYFNGPSILLYDLIFKLYSSFLKAFRNTIHFVGVYQAYIAMQECLLVKQTFKDLPLFLFKFLLYTKPYWKKIQLLFHQKTGGVDVLEGNLWNHFMIFFPITQFEINDSTNCVRYLNILSCYVLSVFTPNNRVQK